MKARSRYITTHLSALTLVLCACVALQAEKPATAPATAAQPAAAPNQDSANDLSVAVGKSVVLDLARPVTRIVVGLGEFAQAAAITPTQVLVNGKAPGETTLILWDTSGGRQFFNVTVRPSTYATNDRLDSIRRELRTELPGQDLRISSEDGNIFLRGTVKDLSSSNRAVTIASTGGKVVNLLNVNVPAPERQILLKVRFASVDRSRERQLGINIFSTGFGNTIGQVSTGQYAPPSVGFGGTTSTVSNELNLFAFYPGINLGATIQALEQQGLVEVLAEPNVLAENGKQASFLAGGMYPYPMVQGAGVGGASAISIMFQQYGVRLNFIPTITPRGTIRLQVAPEVSSLDFADAVQISGFLEPAISVRKVKTEVELSDGQSFAIGGLLDNRETETFQKIPFLGDIPILGKFFQSMQRTRNNTELIVIVTPELVSPAPAGTPIPTPKYPTTFLPPNSNVPMHTPDGTTPGTTPAPSPSTMPVEQLIESMKPEAPMTGDSGGTGYTAAGMNPASPQ